MSLDPATPRKPPQPCKCGAYPFPHRPAQYCVDWLDDQADRAWEAARDRRDLESWAALSRG